MLRSQTRLPFFVGRKMAALQCVNFSLSFSLALIIERQMYRFTWHNLQMFWNSIDTSKPPKKFLRWEKISFWIPFSLTHTHLLRIYYNIEMGHDGNEYLYLPTFVCYIPMAMRLHFEFPTSEPRDLIETTLRLWIIFHFSLSVNFLFSLSLSVSYLAQFLLEEFLRGTYIPRIDSLSSNFDKMRFK